MQASRTARTLLPRLASASSRARPTTAINTRLFHASAANMTVHELKTKADFDAAVKANTVVIIDASAVWCGPCRMISPVLDKLSDQAEFAGIYFAKFDVDNVPELTQELGVRAMPSFFVYKDGQQADSMVGANPPALTRLVEKYK